MACGADRCARAVPDARQRGRFVGRPRRVATWATNGAALWWAQQQHVVDERGCIEVSHRCSFERHGRASADSCRVPPESRLRAAYFEAGAAGCRKTTGASAGTLKGFADDGSELNFENVPGLSLKCFSSVVTRVLFAGWSERS